VNTYVRGRTDGGSGIYVVIGFKDQQRFTNTMEKCVDANKKPLGQDNRTEFIRVCQPYINATPKTLSDEVRQYSKKLGKIQPQIYINTDI